jgi:hypothetical protein
VVEEDRLGRDGSELRNGEPEAGPRVWATAVPGEDDGLRDPHVAIQRMEGR